MGSSKRISAASNIRSPCPALKCSLKAQPGILPPPSCRNEKINRGRNASPILFHQYHFPFLSPSSLLLTGDERTINMPKPFSWTLKCFSPPFSYASSILFEATTGEQREKEEERKERRNGSLSGICRDVPHRLICRFNRRHRHGRFTYLTCLLVMIEPEWAGRKLLRTRAG